MRSVFFIISRSVFWGGFHLIFDFDFFFFTGVPFCFAYSGRVRSEIKQIKCDVDVDYAGRAIVLVS